MRQLQFGKILIVVFSLGFMNLLFAQTPDFGIKPASPATIAAQEKFRASLPADNGLRAVTTPLSGIMQKAFISAT